MPLHAAGRVAVTFLGSHHRCGSAVQVRAHFRPEFVNRIDDFIVFKGLTKGEIKHIARLQAKRVEQRLAAKKIKMVLEDSGVEFLAVGAFWLSCLFAQK